jgi:hypothetical protein
VIHHLFGESGNNDPGFTRAYHTLGRVIDIEVKLEEAKTYLNLA